LLYQKDITQSKLWQAFEAQRNISLSVEVVAGYHDPWEAVTEEVIRVACDQKAGLGGPIQVTTAVNFWTWLSSKFVGQRMTTLPLLGHQMDRNPFGRCVPRRSDTRGFTRRNYSGVRNGETQTFTFARTARFWTRPLFLNLRKRAK
jgi:hypothetical protein